MCGNSLFDFLVFLSDGCEWLDGSVVVTKETQVLFDKAFVVYANSVFCTWYVRLRESPFSG